MISSGGLNVFCPSATTGSSLEPEIFSLEKIKELCVSLVSPRNIFLFFHHFQFQPLGLMRYRFIKINVYYTHKHIVGYYFGGVNGQIETAVQIRFIRKRNNNGRKNIFDLFGRNLLIWLSDGRSSCSRPAQAARPVVSKSETVLRRSFPKPAVYRKRNQADQKKARRLPLRRLSEYFGNCASLACLEWFSKARA